MKEGLEIVKGQNKISRINALKAIKSDDTETLLEKSDRLKRKHAPYILSLGLNEVSLQTLEQLATDANIETVGTIPERLQQLQAHYQNYIPAEKQLQVDSEQPMLGPAFLIQSQNDAELKVKAKSFTIAKKSKNESLVNSNKFPKQSDSETSTFAKRMNAIKIEREQF
jgi:hypothetical protein